MTWAEAQKSRKVVQQHKIGKKWMRLPLPLSPGMRARKREEAKGALVWQLRRRWGMAVIRGDARLILDRMQFVEFLLRESQY